MGDIWVTNPLSLLEPKWRMLFHLRFVFAVSILFPKLLCPLSARVIGYKPMRPASVSLGLLA